MSHSLQRPTKYCHACGNVIDAMAVVCPPCGVMQPAPVGLFDSEKRLLPAVLLCVVLGPFGAHRFYSGRILTGVLQLLTLGGLGIWVLVDFILLVTSNFKDGEGSKITEWT
jgi:hypothetical protein